MANQSDFDQKFQSLVTRHELKQIIADKLKHVLSKCEIVLLCDDSSSMANKIADENNPMVVSNTTRWWELKKLTASLIEIVTCTNPQGLDIYFLNEKQDQHYEESKILQDYKDHFLKIPKEVHH